MIIIGVDPGSVNAGIAVLEVERSSFMPRVLALDDIVSVDKMIEPSILARAIRGVLKSDKPVQAVIERVSAMPKQGVASSFNFGKGCGMIEGVIGALDIPIVRVHPTVWKRKFALSRDGDQSRAYAMKLYPSVADKLAKKKDHNRAEALLLAHWRFVTWEGRF